ncbi:MAG: DNA topoisomerase IV subunit B [Alphaproteobacteria bacterium]
MSDLLTAQQQTSTSYTAKDIEVLEGLEPVRRRPGMYIGGTDSRARHHLVVELLDNAMDEVVAGHADRIEMSLNEDGSITVRDNGRGIPIDPHPKFPDKSALEVILTTLHSGGKFSTDAYKISGGLHGVGVSVVNALASTLTVEVVRDKTLWRQSFSRGIPQGPLEKVGPVHNRRGTTVTFQPDPEIFTEDCRFDPRVLYPMVRSKAYLFKGVEIRWSCPEGLANEHIPAEKRFHFPGGLADYVRTIVSGQPILNPRLFEGSAEFTSCVGRVEWALQWIDDDTGLMKSYCNTVPTPQGGTHENAFRNAILKSLKDFGERLGNKKVSSITADDIMSGAIGVVSLFMQEPQFQGQTKEKLVSTGIGRVIEPLLRDHFDHWLSRNTDEGSALLDNVLERTDHRLRRKKERETARKTATQRLRLPGKLSDCTSTSQDNSEIFLVEGDSAGGSAKQARDRKTQAVLPLRGKILNVASASMEKQLNNQQTRDLAIAFGCGTGKDCNPDKLRYGKIIIMTDADVDGAHIAALLLTFFYREMRPLIEKGMVFLAQPPLYRLATSGKSVYASDDADKDRILATEFKGRKNVEISRFKGLGEMPWTQLRDTTMSSKKRTLLRVKIPPESEQMFAHGSLDSFVMDLMGRRADKRYAFIQENAVFAGDLDI